MKSLMSDIAGFDTSRSLGCQGRHKGQFRATDRLLLRDVFDEDEMRHDEEVEGERARAKATAAGHNGDCHCDDCGLDPGTICDQHEHTLNQKIALGHPECAANEAFLGNVSRPLFCALKWKTKRLGKVSYTAGGRPLKKRYHPLFVTLQELYEVGVSIVRD